jgi:hypothetical protein
LIKVSSNSAEVYDSLLGKIKILRETDKVVRIASLDALVQIVDRVQQKGEKSDGSKIGGGKYSTGYAAKRKKAGRQTSIIDLTFSGDMFDNFTVSPSGRNEYEVGFRNKESADKSEWMEARFGEIFSLSPSEEELNLKAIQDGVNDILR